MIQLLIDYLGLLLVGLEQMSKGSKGTLFFSTNSSSAYQWLITTSN